MAVQMTTHLFDASKVLEVFKERVEEVSKQGLKRKLQEFKSYFKDWIIQGIPQNIHSGKTKSWGEVWEKLQLTLPLFVAPLQLCDYLAAFITRGGKARRLHREALLLLRKGPLNLS
jgi:hypothetical protein